MILAIHEDRFEIFSSGHFLIGALSWALAIQSQPFKQIFKGNASWVDLYNTKMYHVTIKDFGI